MAHVLIVDDDVDIRLTVRAVLEDLGGHTVLEAADGISGLAQVRASEASLVVLLDLLMPGMSGIQVLQVIADDEELVTRHSYVLVSVSRRASPANVPPRMASIVPIVPKPFDINVLLDTVTAAERRIQTPNNT